MACHARHNDSAIAPWSEVVREFVILDIGRAPDTMLQPINKCSSFCQMLLTVLRRPPARCWATALAIAGFSATQRIFWPGILHTEHHARNGAVHSDQRFVRFRPGSITKGRSMGKANACRSCYAASGTHNCYPSSWRPPDH